jgi:predicted GNAT family acetyltransferase
MVNTPFVRQNSLPPRFKLALAQMTADHDIALATPDDIPGILALQEPNLVETVGGGISVRQTAEWFERTMREMPLVVARRGGKIVGYVVATSLAAKSHVAIVQAMLQQFPAPPNCYSYGPVCVAESERGKGLAGAMFERLRAQLPGRPAMTFVRADNGPSLTAHRKMGMRELGAFSNEGVTHIAFAY